jgi:NTE family protein
MMNRRKFLVSATSLAALPSLGVLSGCAGGIAEYNGTDAPSFAPYAADRAPRIALVMGAGGPRGFAHIGALKVLEDAGFDADLVVGASVGAMLGVLYANRMSARAMETLALELSAARFIGLSTSGFQGNGNAIYRWVESQTNGKALNAFSRKLAVVAARKKDNSLAIFTNGDTAAAVRASSAMPEHFAPVIIRGETYFDGDEASPVPIKAARALGAKVVVALDVSAHVSAIPPHAPADWQVRDRKRAAMVAAEAPQADVLIHPDLGYYASISPEYRRMCIARGEASAREALPKIKEALARMGNTG